MFRLFGLQRLAQGALPRRWRRGHFARAPFVGYAEMVEGKVFGWVVHPRQAIVALRLGGAPLTFGQPRPDVAARFPGLAAAATSGFAGDSAGLHGELDIIAVAEDGRERPCFRLRLPLRAPLNGVAAALTPSGLPPLEAVVPLMLATRPRLVVVLGAAPALVAAARAASGAVGRPVAVYAVGGDIVEDGWTTALPPQHAAAHFTGGTVSLVVCARAERALLDDWRRALADDGLVLCAEVGDAAGWCTRAVARAVVVARDPEVARHAAAALGEGEVETPPPPLPTSETPEVSVIIPVHGRWGLTRRCLTSIAAFAPATPFEVIVVDDASPDDSAAALAGVAGVRVLHNADNVGFGESCNRGAAAARGRFLLVLNNDTVVSPGWLDELRRTVDEVPRVGIVGGKIVLESGVVQELGSAIAADGSASNLARGADPERADLRHLRDVDYVSGVLLFIERALFLRLGGFDRRFDPGYYEDVDLAFRVRAAGLRVVAQPLARVQHREGGTMGVDVTRGRKRHQILNRDVFVARWREVLAQPRPAPPPRILIIDHTVPRPSYDSGSLRMSTLLRLLCEVGVLVTFVADDPQALDDTDLRRIGVEVLPARSDIAAHLAAQGARYQAVLLSRRDPAARHFASARRLAPQARVIFDTVDLHFLREQRAAQLHGGAASGPEVELALARDADATIVVSSDEAARLRALGCQAPLHVIGNLHAVVARAAPFAARRDLIFVGYFQHAPNADGVVWFVDEVLPRVRAQLPAVRLHVVGADPPALLAADDGVVVHGHVPELAPLLDGARLSVAPLRFGAGVKGKITEALSRGLPVVTTSVGAEGLGDSDALLVADDPASFAAAIVRAYDDAAAWQRRSDAALATARAGFSVDTVRARLTALLTELGLRGQP